MDRKSIIILVVCFGVLLFGSKLIDKLVPPIPLPPGATNQISTAASPTNATQAAFTPVDTNRVVAAPRVVLPAGATEQTLVISNSDARYTFTSRGGGLSTVELLHYPETVSRHNKKLGTNEVATLNTPHAAPVLAIFGSESVQDDAPFALTQTAGGVRAEKTLTNGLHLVKEFQIGTNYLIHTTVRFENTSGQPIKVSPQEWVIGTATPMDGNDKGEVQGAMWYNGSKTEEKVRSWFDNAGFLFWGGVPRHEFRAGETNVVWAAVHNQFFVLAAMSTNPATQMISRAIELPRPVSGWSSFPNNPAPKGLQTTLAYPEITIPAGQAAERQIHFFAGPKEYRTLARIAARFNNNVDLVMNFGWVGFFSKALLLSMNWLVHTFHFGYGLAIIVITIIIKLLFWPITAAQTRMSRRMAALQPQMKVLQEKYKDDPMKMQKKMGEFWKEHKINPMSGCLPLLLQMPVFFGFFSMIRTAIELRGASFLWVADLSKPDTLFIIPGLNFIPFIGTPEGLPFNLLPLFMGVTMLWQAHLTPPSPGMDPSQQKIMKYMPLIFILFLYNYSSGLALYWTVQNILSIVQTKLTKIEDPNKAPASVLTPVSKKKK